MESSFLDSSSSRDGRSIILGVFRLDQLFTVLYSREIRPNWPGRNQQDPSTAQSVIRLGDRLLPCTYINTKANAQHSSKGATITLLTTMNLGMTLTRSEAASTKRTVRNIETDV
jgi:hypothetical protein